MSATPADVLPGPLEEELLRRLELAASDATSALGLPVQPDTSGDLESLRTLIDAVGDRLAAGGFEGADALREEHVAALGRLGQRFEGRFEALARVQAAVGDLRRLTSPSEMLAAAPASLCNGSTLRRAILSLVTGGRMVVHSVHFAGDPEGAREALQALRARPPLLEHPLIETELLRRRRATIVVDAHVHPRVDRHLAQTMGWRAYAAAPVVVGRT